MTTTEATPTPTARAAPRGVLGVLAYLGGLGGLAAAAARAAIRPRGPAPAMASAVAHHLDDLIGRGLPLVALVHVPIGSFLAMQAFFHATFTEAVGAVVGIGLLRNLAPLLTGMVLAALLVVRIVPELRRGEFAGLDDPSGSVPDRDVRRGVRPDDRPAPEPARLAAVRILAAAIAGPVLATWGAVIGLLIGLVLARAKLGVSAGIFMGKLAEMIQPGDAAGLVGKAMLFATVAALIACHEGLRGGNDRRDATDAAYRAICVALTAMLVINACWFTLEYLSGPPFGPSLAPR